MGMIERVMHAAFGARYGNDLIELLRMQTERVDALSAENEQLRTINLDLGRYCQRLLEGLIIEINDPGTIGEEMILHAASDMADQVARMEEHHV